MSDKNSDEAHYAAHDDKNGDFEKSGVQAYQPTQAEQAELADSPNRRGSVALNIVHNPLKVSSDCARTERERRWLIEVLSQNVSKEQTVEDARIFAEKNEMAELADLFGRAALVARDPEDFNQVTELTEEERHALTYEHEHKWNGPFMLWYSVGLCAVGAATQVSTDNQISRT